MKILGIDYGTKRVGIALSNDTQSVAFPRGVLPNDAMLVKKISALIADEGVREVVLGYSKNYHQKDNLVMKDILAFKNILVEETGVSVYFEPEILTSQQAMRIQGDIAMLDASAAALILQTFLQRRHGFEL